MVGVAQLVERLVVVQDVAGSSPVVHPKRASELLSVVYKYRHLETSHSPV